LGAIDTMHITHAFEYGDDKHENYEQNKPIPYRNMSSQLSAESVQSDILKFKSKLG